MAHETLYTPFIRESNIELENPIDIRGYQRKYFTPEVQEEVQEEVKEDVKPEEIGTPVVSPIVEIRERVTSNPTSIKSDYTSDRKGFGSFKTAYENSGVSKDRFNFFAKLAEKESGFNASIQNLAGAPAYGYFQFMQGSANGKSWDNITRFAGVDTATFRNSPELQIKAADKLANAFLKGFSKEDIKKARDLGYSDSALIAGAWLGGVGGVRKLLHQGISVDDKSWSKEGKGTDVRTRMSEFNNFFKLGGIIKAQDGNVLKGKNWLLDWLYNRKDILKWNIEKNMPISIPFPSKLGYNIAALNINLANAKVDPSKLIADDIGGQFNTGTRRIYLRHDDTSDAIHEYTHASIPNAQVDEINNIKDLLGDNMYDNNTVPPDEYLDDSREIYSRLMQLRHALDVDPNHKFTNEEIEELKNSKLRKTTITNRNIDGTFVVNSYDKDGKPINTHSRSVGEHYDPEEFSLKRSYDSKGSFNILNRYSTDFIRRLMNDVADNKTDHDTSRYA